MLLIIVGSLAWQLSMFHGWEGNNLFPFWCLLDWSPGLSSSCYLYLYLSHTLKRKPCCHLHWPRRWAKYGGREGHQSWCNMNHCWNDDASVLNRQMLYIWFNIFSGRFLHTLFIHSSIHPSFIIQFILCLSATTRVTKAAFKSITLQTN